MTQEILLVGTLQASLETALAALYVVHRATEDPASLTDVMRGVRIMVTSGGTGAPRELVEALPGLKLIAVFGVGVDRVDLDHARARGIAVTNTPDVLTDDVADLAVGLVLATGRRIAANDRFVRAGSWAGGGRVPLTRRVTGRRFGIVGLGRIGSAIARRLEPFAGSIAYTARHRVEGTSYEYFPELVELARAVDVLVVAVSGGATSAGLVDAAVIDALGPDGLLVNIARGSVVDEAALVAALMAGRLGGAGLDVFADEPNVPAALLAMDNVVLQPHQGSATEETRAAMGALVLDNVAAFVAGQKLLTPC